LQKAEQLKKIKAGKNKKQSTVRASQTTTAPNIPIVSQG
jgi:hypothetical protein